MDSQSIGSVAQVNANSQASQPATTRATNQAQQQLAAKQAEAAAKAREEAKAAEKPVQEIKAPQRDPRSLQYQVDAASRRVVATIVDDGNKTVIRQIPDAEVLRIAQAIDRMQGFLVEEKA